MKGSSGFSMSPGDNGAGGETASSPSHLPAAESIEVLAARRLLELAEWRQILLYGADEERVALVSTLRDIDLEPLYTALDEDDAVVAETSSQARMLIALDALRRNAQELIAAGRFDAAATMLDLDLSVSLPGYRDNAGRIDQPE